LQTSAGKETLLQTRTPRLDLGRWVDLRVQYDADSGILALSLNGKLAAKARTSGPLAPDLGGDLSLGNPFGQKSFDGFVDRLELRANQSAYAR
jgi:hypothetical protein